MSCFAFRPQVAVAACEKEIECAVDVDPRLRVLSLVSDASRIQQIVANFGWNAIKYVSQSGNVTFRALLVPSGSGEGSTAEERPGWARVRFEVEDDGPGIDEQMQARHRCDGLWPGRAAAEDALSMCQPALPGASVLTTVRPLCPTRGPSRRSSSSRTKPAPTTPEWETSTVAAG